MKKRKVYYLAGLAITGALALTGCKKSTEEVETEPKITYNSEVLDYYNEEPETKTFEPYQHCFFKEYTSVYSGEKEIRSKEIGYVERGSITVPEGYIIIGISDINDGHQYTGTKAVHVWYTNIETVEVEPVFNEKTNAYDYSEFGKVIELEKEENSKTLK